ncbi:MAG: hypothetical protein L0Z55_02580 [Planctomycetes bacterium]|nr:hypothetical protein [Planctomycetota bacterium]
MKIVFVAVLPAVIMLASCSERVDDAIPYEAEFLRQVREYDAQTRKINEQLAETDAQLKRSKEQSDRLEALLSRWEQQAERYDAILLKWEAVPTPPGVK